jgi:hypothetical protein
MEHSDNANLAILSIRSFILANERKLMFADEGKHFQDTVIFLSVVEYLKNDPTKEGILISNDKRFGDCKSRS